MADVASMLACCAEHSQTFPRESKKGFEYDALLTRLSSPHTHPRCVTCVSYQVKGTLAA